MGVRLYYFEIFEATKNDVIEIKFEIVDIISGLESLKSCVEHLELARTAQENELSSIKQKILALRHQIEKEPGSSELASRVLMLENVNRRRNVIIWNIKSESKSRAKDHVDTLL